MAQAGRPIMNNGELSPPPYVPPGGPPRHGPSRDVYAAMGSENIHRMLEDLYVELERSDLRPMFPEDMKAASRKSAAFFIGLLGGPPLYQQLYGEPMMRRRHLHLRIDEAARQGWLTCFEKVLEHAPERYAFPEEHLPGFRAFLDEFSAWMVNTK